MRWLELGGDILKNRIEKLKQNDSSPDEQAVGKTGCCFFIQVTRAILKQYYPSGAILPREILHC